MTNIVVICMSLLNGIFVHAILLLLQEKQHIIYIFFAPLMGLRNSLSKKQSHEDFTIYLFIYSMSTKTVDLKFKLVFNFKLKLYILKIKKKNIIKL